MLWIGSFAKYFKLTAFLPFNLDSGALTEVGLISSSVRTLTCLSDFLSKHAQMLDVLILLNVSIMFLFFCQFMYLVYILPFSGFKSLKYREYMEGKGKIECCP